MCIRDSHATMRSWHRMGCRESQGFLVWLRRDEGSWKYPSGFRIIAASASCCDRRHSATPAWARLAGGEPGVPARRTGETPVAPRYDFFRLNRPHRTDCLLYTSDAADDLTRVDL